MGHKTVRNLLLAGSLACSVSAFADGPSASMLSQPCAGCHGIDGSSVGPASPTIAGISEDYFLESMNAYRDEERPSTIMGRIAKGYSEDEIEAMATWFSEKPFVHAQQTSDSKKATKGKKLHEKYCEKCHEEGGSLDDGTGVLAGQWIPYLRYSMQDFLSEARVAPKKMKKRVNALVKEHGDQGIEAIVQYYGSQQ